MFYGLLLTLPVLLVFSALASGSETAMFGLTGADRAALEQRHPVAARAVAALLARPRSLLILVLVLNMTINVAYFAVSSVLTLSLEHPMAASGMTAGCLLAIILFGEVFAKIAAASARVRVCSLIAGPLLVLVRVGGPLLWVLDVLVVGPLARLIHPDQAASRVSTMELTKLVQIEGTDLTPEEQMILSHVLELRLRRAREIMTPRVDLRWVGSDWSTAEVLEFDEPFVPISSDELHCDVHGSIDVRRLATGSRSDAVQSPVFVPEQARLDQVLGVLAAQKAECAYCVDELGEVTGMVLLDDIADELAAGVGSGEGYERLVREVGRGVWIVPGRLSLRDFAEAFALDADESGAEPWSGSARVSTLAGLVQSNLGRMPVVGDVVAIGRFDFEVSQMRGNGVRRLRVRRRDASEARDE
jgi:CBS domain containing-hemolysin-like protein